jgi:hypothetical protein
MILESLGKNELPPARSNFNSEYMTENEKESIESHLLRCRRHLAIHGEMTEELFQVVLDNCPWLLETHICPEEPQPLQITLLRPIRPVPKAESPDDLFFYCLPRYPSVYLFLFHWYDRLHPCEIPIQADSLPCLLHLPVLILFSQILEIGGYSVTEVTVDIVAGTEVVVPAYPAKIVRQAIRVCPDLPKGKWLIFKGLLTSIYQGISRGC